MERQLNATSTEDAITILRQVIRGVQANADTHDVLATALNTIAAKARAHDRDANREGRTELEIAQDHA